MAKTKPVLLPGLWAGLLGLLLLAPACTPTPYPAAVAASPPAPASTPTAPPTATATSTPLPGPPSATPTPTAPVDNLAPYRWAMRPEFAGDVDAVAAAGASRYTIQVTVELPASGAGSPALTGREQVHYTNTESVALNDIVFRLYPNLPGYGGQMVVTGVKVGNRPVTPILEAGNSALRVPLAHPLPPGHTTTISLTYQAQIPAAGAGYNIFSFTNNTAALAGFYPAVAVYDDSGWDVQVPPPYGDATYLDVSLYRVELTAPQEMVVAASGSVLARQSNANGTQTLSLVSGPMRDFYIAMRPDYRRVSQTVNGIVVNSYFPSELEAGGRLALRYAAGALAVFNRRIGPYPYAEFDLVATPTTAGGVEYPGIVVLSERLYGQEGGFFQHAAAHEVAHQWWYGLVGNNQIDDPWLDESLTNYSTILYWEESEGPDAAAGIIAGYFRGPYERAKNRGNDRPVVGPVAAFSESDYSIFVYGKGALYFDALRQTAGNETFLTILQTYYARHKYGLAYPADFLAVVNQIAGNNAEPLFETWMLR